MAFFRAVKLCPGRPRFHMFLSLLLSGGIKERSFIADFITCVGMETERAPSNAASNPVYAAMTLLLFYVGPRSVSRTSNPLFLSREIPQWSELRPPTNSVISTIKRACPSSPSLSTFITRRIHHESTRQHFYREKAHGLVITFFLIMPNSLNFGRKFKWSNGSVLDPMV